MTYTYTKVQQNANRSHKNWEITIYFYQAIQNLMVNFQFTWKNRFENRSLSSSLLNICARFSNFFFENLLSPRVIRLYRLRTFLFPVLMIRISILYVYFFSEFCCWYSWFFPKFAKFAKKPCWWHWFENTPYCRVNFCPLNRAINLKFPIYFRFCP